MTEISLDKMKKDIESFGAQKPFSEYLIYMAKETLNHYHYLEYIEKLKKRKKPRLRKRLLYRLLRRQNWKRAREYTDWDTSESKKGPYSMQIPGVDKPCKVYTVDSVPTGYFDLINESDLPKLDLNGITIKLDKKGEQNESGTTSGSYYSTLGIKGYLYPKGRHTSLFQEW